MLVRIEQMCIHVSNMNLFCLIYCPSINDLEPFTLEFNQKRRQTQKSLDDDEENCQATEQLFRSLPEIRYRFYVINAACLCLTMLIIQALILET
jgi:hypothetical protein